MSLPAAVLKGVGRLLGAGKPPAPSRRIAEQAAFVSHVASAYPNHAFRTIFDVGANVGHVTGYFRQARPQAIIHAFEPAPESAAALRAAFGADPQVAITQCALGSEAGAIRFQANGVSAANHAVGEGDAGANVIDVEVLTGDDYCRSAGIDDVSFLKIDTEGYDLEVLKGFAETLGRHRVDFVQVEAGMNPENRRHVPFEALKGYLEGHGYRVFRLYEQSLERRLPVLRRINATFVSPPVAEANKRAP